MFRRVLFLLRLERRSLVKQLLLSLFLLPLALQAQDVPEYMKNDGNAAPETIDQAVEEGRIQREEAEEEIQREEEEVLTPQDFGLESEEPYEDVTPDANAQKMQEEEAERVEDNYLIGPYNGKGEYSLPAEKEEAIKESE